MGAGVGTLYRIYQYTGATKLAYLDSAEDGNLTGGVHTIDPPMTTTSHFDIGYIPKHFAINDINIIYREKTIK